MGEFHAEDYVIQDDSANKQKRPRPDKKQPHASGPDRLPTTGKRTASHFENAREGGDSRAKGGNWRGRDPANEPSQVLVQRRRSSAEGERIREKPVGGQGQRNQKSYEAGDAVDPRRGSKQSTGRYSAYVAKHLGTAAAVKAAEGMNHGSAVSKEQPGKPANNSSKLLLQGHHHHLKSPAISDGAGDEWETASEHSRSPSEEGGRTRRREVEKPPRGKGKPGMKEGGPVGADRKKPPARPKSSGTYLERVKREKEEKERMGKDKVSGKRPDGDRGAAEGMNDGREGSKFLSDAAREQGNQKQQPHPKNAKAASQST